MFRTFLISFEFPAKGQMSPPHLLVLLVGAAPGHEGVSLLGRLILQLGVRYLDAVVVLVKVIAVVLVDAVLGNRRQRPLPDFGHLFVKVLHPDARW